MKKRVLVVEDNRVNMYLIGFILEKNGYEVIRAETGKEGVNLAIEEKPDLILMDIMLPDIDGLEATKRIRESGADGDVPIIALTSYAMVGDKDKAMFAGCTGYIEKPIDPETIIGEIEKYLQGSS
ncbi:MAG TPA: response regulator [Actinobacteria bacterium]|nr:response regulator [Actinomycetota bacterium]